MQNKIREFPNKPAYNNYLDYSGELSRIAGLQSILEGKRDILEVIKEENSKVLRQCGRNIGRMELIYDDYIESVMSDFEPFSFVFASRKKYELRLEFEPQEDGTTEIRCTLSHTLPDGIEYYILEADKWIKEPKGWADNIPEEDSAKTAFLNMCLEMDIFSEDEDDGEEFNEYYEENQPLMALYDKMDGILDFGIINEPDGSVTACLEPENTYIAGFTVTCSDGEYHIMQLIDSFSTAQAYEEMHPDSTENPYIGFKRQTVYSTADVGRVVHCLMLMLDHYFKDEDI